MINLLINCYSLLSFHIKVQWFQCQAVWTIMGVAASINGESLEIYSREQQNIKVTELHYSDTDSDVHAKTTKSVRFDSAENCVLYEHNPDLNETIHTPSGEFPSPQDTKIMAHHSPLASRPSVVLGKFEKHNLNIELELEQIVVGRNKKLNAVFEGFEVAEKYLENKGPQHFGPLYKLLHDNFVTVFSEFQKNDERTVMANKLARSQ